MPRIQYAAIAATVLGWLVFLATLTVHGDAATESVGYGIGLALGASGVVVWASSNVAAVYALGFRDGARSAEGQPPIPSRSA